MTPAEIRNTHAVTSYAAPTQETLPQVTSAANTVVTPLQLKNLLSGQASVIRKLDHFTARSLGYAFFKLTTYFSCLSFLTNNETKKVIREITALDKVTGQIRDTANKVAKVLHNTIGTNASSSVEELVDLAKQLASLEQHDFLGSKTAYVAALSNLVKNNSAGFLGTRTTVDNIEAFKAYLLKAIEKTAPTFTGTINTNTTLPLSEPRAPTVPPQAAEQRPAEIKRAPALASYAPIALAAPLQEEEQRSSEIKSAPAVASYAPIALAAPLQEEEQRSSEIKSAPALASYAPIALALPPQEEEQRPEQRTRQRFKGAPLAIPQDTATITHTEPAAPTPLATPASNNRTALWLMPLPANEQTGVLSLLRDLPNITDEEIDARIAQYTPNQQRAFDVVMHQQHQIDNPSPLQGRSAPVTPTAAQDAEETRAISPDAAGALGALLIQESQRPQGPTLRPTTASYRHPIFQRIAELTALVEGQNLEETDPQQAASIIAEIMKLKAGLDRALGR